jgi:hypothetical protein
MIKKEQGKKATTTGGKKRRWEAMTLTDLGDIRSVIQGGGGKLSTPGGDPGENRKPSGGGDP